jgi:hypothetical protein
VSCVHIHVRFSIPISKICRGIECSGEGYANSSWTSKQIVRNVDIMMDVLSFAKYPSRSGPLPFAKEEIERLARHLQGTHRAEVYASSTCDGRVRKGA